MPVSATVASAAGAARFTVEYVDGSGALIQAPLAISSQIPFECSPPVQQPRSFKGQANFTGLWWMATTRSHVGFESWLKRDQLIALDFDPTVTAVALRPFSLTCSTNGTVHRHMADYFARRDDGTAVVIDVISRGRDRHPAASELMAAAADHVGWDYRIVSRLDVTFLANLRWLAGYRHPRCVDPSRASTLREAFSTPLTVAEGIAGLGDRLAVLPSLFYLLWRGVLSADLHAQVLGSQTLVTTVREQLS